MYEYKLTFTFNNLIINPLTPNQKLIESRLLKAITVLISARVAIILAVCIAKLVLASKDRGELEFFPLQSLNLKIIFDYL